MSATLLRKIVPYIPTWLIRILGNLYPPYRGAGIKVTYISPDYRTVRVVLKKKFSTTNYVGTQFGGSIYSMVDPFFMLIIMQNLGKNYYVWDRAAFIEYVKPGKTQLTAEFHIDKERLVEFKTQADLNDKFLIDLPVEIKDANGDVVARVVKEVYIKRKIKKPANDTPKWEQK